MIKVLKILGITLIISFLIMFFTSSSGYYEYELNKKSNLTQEAIEQFEQDIKDGKEIDIQNYLVTEEKDYSNSFSKAGIQISQKIGAFFKEGVKILFDSIGNLVND